MTCLRPYISFLLIGILCGMASCRRDIRWSDTQKVIGDEWTPRNPVMFDLDPLAYNSPYKDEYERKTSEAIGDTVPRLHGSYKAFLSLRYTDRCTASALDIIVENEALEGERECDTLRYQLFSDADDRPVAKGRFGIHEVSKPLPRPYNARSGSIITVYPVEYARPVRGIESVTLILQR